MPLHKNKKKFRCLKYYNLNNEILFILSFCLKKNDFKKIIWKTNDIRETKHKMPELFEVFIFVINVFFLCM